MKTVLIPVLFALTTLAWAEHEVMPVGRLRLLDGRMLENVVIRSYDPQISKVLLIANGRALLIPITLIPPPYAEKIKAENERTRSATDLVQTTPLPAPTAPARTSPKTDSVSTPPAPPPSAPLTPAVVAPDPRQAHQAVAIAHALRYFRYESRVGSNYISVTNSDIEIDDTEPVPGWDQYRTTGKVYLEIYDSVGGSFSRRTRTFEVITEQKPGKEIKVVDFTSE